MRVMTIVLTSACAALLSGGMTLAAADPLANLPSQVMGVVGSGNSISLQLKEEGKTRVLQIGDTYSDGWILTGLSPSVATLSMGGNSRTVGLNPANALSTEVAQGPQSTVTVLGDRELALLKRAVDLGLWDGSTPAVGLTLDETRQSMIFAVRLQDMRDAAAEKGQRVALSAPAQLIAALGEDGPAYSKVMQKMYTAMYNQSQADFARLGPVSVRVPAGADKSSVFAAAGLSGMHMTAGSTDSSGGTTYTLTPAPNSYLTLFEIKKVP